MAVTGRSNLIDVNADLIFETEKAYKVRSDAGKEVWIPKSLCEHDEDKGVFTMSIGIAEEKGLV